MPILAQIPSRVRQRITCAACALLVCAASVTAGCDTSPEPPAPTVEIDKKVDELKLKVDQLQQKAAAQADAGAALIHTTDATEPAPAETAPQD